MLNRPLRRSSPLLVVIVGTGCAGMKNAAIEVGAAPGPSRRLLAQFPPATVLSHRARESVRFPVRSSNPAFLRSPSPRVFAWSSMLADQFRHGSSLLLLLRCC